MRREPDVGLHALLELHQAVEELRVVEPVQVQQVLHVLACGAHLDGPVDLRAEVRAAQREHRENGRPVHELGVVHELCRCERRERVDEQLRGGNEVAARAQAQALVHLQPVLALPVTALLDERVRLVEQLLERRMIVEEERDPHLAKNNVNFLAECNRVREKVREVALALGVVCRLEREQDKVLERHSHVFFALRLSRVLELLAELLELGSILRLNFSHKFLIDGPAKLLAERLVERDHAVLADRVHERALVVCAAVGLVALPELGNSHRRVWVERRGLGHQVCELRGFVCNVSWSKGVLQWQIGEVK